MPQSFECPKCGAPLSYNAAEQNYAETIACPYCNNSVIVPEQLRVRPPQVIHSRFEVVDRSERGQQASYYQSGAPIVREVGKRPNALIGGCITAIVLMVIFFGVGAALFATRISKSAFDGAGPIIQNLLTPEPTATDIASSIETQIAPLIAEVTAAVEQLNTPLIEPTAAPTETPEPTLDLTATAAVELEAERASMDAMLINQRGWRLVLNEKFDNANRNWNVGSNNGKLSVEDLKITGNRYIWQITSKKSMGSFSFPDMDSQTDIYVSVEMQMTNSTGNFSDQAGIIFRQNNGAFYFFGANPQGSYSLRLYDGGGWNNLIDLSESETLTSRQVNLLEVSMQGTQIILAINQVTVGWVEDSWLSEGVAGLGVNLPAPGEDATVTFSNFQVRTP